MSVSLAVTATPTRGWTADSVTVPSSFTLVTLTSMSLVPRLPSASLAPTVSSYVLSLSASPGASKLGGLLKVSTSL